MFRLTAIGQIFFVFVLASCSSTRDCDPDFQRYSVYLYRTPEQNFLFFKNDTRRPIDFSAEENPQFLKKIDKVFSGFYGRSIGVEASVCGRMDRVDLSLSPYTHSLTIRQASILRNVDVTDMIEVYEKALGAPRN